MCLISSNWFSRIELYLILFRESSQYISNLSEEVMRLFGSSNILVEVFFCLIGMNRSLRISFLGDELVDEQKERKWISGEKESAE